MDVVGGHFIEGEKGRKDEGKEEKRADGGRGKKAREEGRQTR